MFVNFFGKITQTEPVWGTDMIVNVAVSNVCNIATFIASE
jgi:hypothetical protein